MSDAGFYLLAAGAVLSALAVITARNLVHAALFLVAHFALTAGLYLLLHAPFVAAVQLVVYAGAIMVLFLFVVMILGDRDEAPGEPLPRQRVLGAAGLVVLGGLLAYVMSGGLPAAVSAGGAAPAVADDFGSPLVLAEALFRRHVLPFEVVSVLLLVAMIGAVALARAGRVVPDADAEAPEGAEEE